MAKTPNSFEEEWNAISHAELCAMMPYDIAKMFFEAGQRTLPPQTAAVPARERVSDMALIERTEWKTLEEAKAYTSGVYCLTDMVLDYGQKSISVDEPISTNGVFIVFVHDTLEDDKAYEDDYDYGKENL